MDENFFTDRIHDLHNTINSILKNNLKLIRSNQQHDARTLALLKVLAEEIVLADPTSKARMHNRLDQLLLLHGDDQAFCDGVKQAVKVIDAT
ncbi:MAG: hypothetical protein EOO38_09190 [Cytophagaceae bacterium]|nr:MAG: hypothetical protein EOO38_09190 [Cytophagaceae bacterium]